MYLYTQILRFCFLSLKDWHSQEQSTVKTDLNGSPILKNVKPPVAFNRHNTVFAIRLNRTFFPSRIIAQNCFYF